MEDSPLKWRVGPRGPAHRDGDRGDEPRPPARPARPQLGLPARAPLPDRHALRPLRDARARGDRLLHLLGLAVRPRRHAVRDLALPRGRRAPVDLDPGDRDRDARADVRRAVLRARARVAAARRARRGCRRRTASRSTCASRRRRSTRRRSPPPSTRVGEERLRADVVAGGFRLREPGAGEDRVVLAACGAIVPEALARSRAARNRGRRRGDRALPLLTRPPLPRLAGEPHCPAPGRPATAVPPRAAARARTSAGSPSSR